MREWIGLALLLTKLNMIDVLFPFYAKVMQIDAT